MHLQKNTYKHVYSLTPGVSSVTRACGCSAPVLIGGLTSAMVSYFHPPQILKETDEKEPEIKGAERASGCTFFQQNSNSFNPPTQLTGSWNRLVHNKKVGRMVKRDQLRKHTSTSIQKDSMEMK